MSEQMCNGCGDFVDAQQLKELHYCKKCEEFYGNAPGEISKLRKELAAALKLAGQYNHEKTALTAAYVTVTDELAVAREALTNALKEIEAQRERIEELERIP